MSLVVVTLICWPSRFDVASHVFMAHAQALMPAGSSAVWRYIDCSRELKMARVYVAAFELAAWVDVSGVGILPSSTSVRLGRCLVKHGAGMLPYASCAL